MFSGGERAIDVGKRIDSKETAVRNRPTHRFTPRVAHSGEDQRVRAILAPPLRSVLGPAAQSAAQWQHRGNRRGYASPLRYASPVRALRWFRPPRRGRLGWLAVRVHWGPIRFAHIPVDGCRHPQCVIELDFEGGD